MRATVVDGRAGRAIPTRYGFGSDASGQQLIGPDRNWLTWSIPVAPGRTYRIVRESRTVRFRYGYTADPPGPFLPLVDYWSGDSAMEATTTAPEGVAWLHVYVANDGAGTLIRVYES
ncbi:hypothetical protein [Sediminivirga luteola]|uniref:Uncharacterized protein n=1 Tax=Sediminivirga luteola TaxID=1774748 RepID=A0A8J2XK03_9MICO|nr:hypothetical protein [Sediminivirga luteola]GGA10541.1 hypothetical protein GCM10011333_11680 [Sediminivirga luteola]